MTEEIHHSDTSVEKANRLISKFFCSYFEREIFHHLLKSVCIPKTEISSISSS